MESEHQETFRELCRAANTIAELQMAAAGGAGGNRSRDGREAETPRTDSQEVIYGLDSDGYQIPCVSIEFARDLERELYEAFVEKVAVVREFVEKVERKAEDKMLKTGKLEGAHYAAMKQLQAEMEGGK